jgi:hypothetical protein
MSAIDTSHLIPDLRELVRVALELGWTARMGSNRKTVMLRSHDGKKTLAVDPVKSMNDRLLRQKQATVMRYGDPIKVALLDAAVEMPSVMKGTTTLDGVIRAMSGGDTEVESGVSEVSRAPWRARRVSNPKGGVVYDSDAVVEVRYSDGSVRWECAFGCGYTHESNPRSVAAHFGKAHTMKGESAPAEGGRERIDPTYTEPITHRDYTPTERLIRLLQHAIEEAMDGSWTTRDLAVAVLRWQHERVGEGGEPRPSEPLTDSQIVERIRLMLDTGESVEQERKVAALEAEVRLAEHALLVMEQRATKAEGTLNALAELAGDAVRDAS